MSSRPQSGQRLSSGTEGQASETVPIPIPSSSALYVTTSTQTLTTSPLSIVQNAPSEAALAVPKKAEIITYEKSTQTGDSWEPQRSRADGTDDSLEDDASSERKAEELERIRQDLRKEIEEELRATLDTTKHSGNDTSSEQERFPLRTLTEEEREAVLQSKEFKDFVDTSTKVIDRALDEQYDILIDYTQGSGEVEEDDDTYGKGQSRRGRRIKQVAQYWDERRSKKRMVSDICFSPKVGRSFGLEFAQLTHLQYPELLLAAYTKNPTAPQEPHGLVQIWNSHMPSRPEYVFHNPSSDILTAKFSPFHPNLIVGGCYSGQVLLWDMRSNSPNPVQKTPLTGSGHTHPVYSLEVIGTQNANNIISCSTDGVVCTWSVDMLSQPQEKLELKSPGKAEDIAPQCIAFPPSDPTYFLAGTEEGTVYSCSRYERAGGKAGVDARLVYSGHAAPVVSLDFHPARGPVDLGDLLLSASMDWTIKLWRVRPPAALGTAVTGATTAQGPILDIAREDIIYDVKWSPVRPGIFAVVDGAGVLEVWDLNHDIEVPAAKTQPTADLGAAWPKRSLNKCAWEQNEGKKIAVGGLDGVVTVFEVGHELGGIGPAEEWTLVKKQVTRAESQQSASLAVNGR